MAGFCGTGNAAAPPRRRRPIPYDERRLYTICSPFAICSFSRGDRGLVRCGEAPALPLEMTEAKKRGRQTEAACAHFCRRVAYVRLSVLPFAIARATPRPKPSQTIGPPTTMA